MTAPFSGPDRACKTVIGQILETKGGCEGPLMSREFCREQVFPWTLGYNLANDLRAPYSKYSWLAPKIARS